MFTGTKPLKPVSEGLADSLSDDQRYWNRLKEVSVFQESGNITSTEFLPLAPFHLASTCNNRLTVYDTSLCEPLSIYSRFKLPLYCATYRSDGALLGTGTHDGHVHFFDVHDHKKSGPRNPVRSFHNAHTCRINALAYESSLLRFISMADDGLLKLWDLAEAAPKTAEPVWKCQAHEDHVRSGVFAQSNEHLFLTGSYDHTVKVWDTRMDSSSASSLMRMEHGSPVEKVLLFANETIAASAGGTTIKLWDMSAGGKLMHTIEGHYKTVTSMCFASNKTCILSGGLDRRINAFRCDSGTFELVKSWKAAAPILTLSMSENDEYMVFGMSNLLSIHRRKPEEDKMNGSLLVEQASWSEAGVTRKEPLFVKSEVVRQSKRVGASPVKQRERGIEEVAVVELTARQLDKMHLGALDHLLKLKKYRELVSTMMSKELPSTHPEMVVSAFQQLRIRQKLHLALSGHGEEELVPLLEFLRLNLFKSAFFDVLLDVVNVFFTIYGEEEMTPSILSSVNSLQQSISAEVLLQKQMCKTVGVLDMFMSLSSSAGRRKSANVGEVEEGIVTEVVQFNADEA